MNTQASGDSERLVSDMREAMADPVFADDPPPLHDGQVTDLLVVQQQEDAIDQIVRTYGGFDVLVSNAGVLKAESVAQRDSRLLLCDLVARTLQVGLALLGIRVVDKM